MRLCTLLVCLAATLAVPTFLGAVTLDLLDDRGVPIEAELELCLIDGLATACNSLPPRTKTVELEIFDYLTAEGPEHGPVRMARRDLNRDGAGRLVLVVPRKAHLKLDNPLAESVMVSLYDVRSAGFRRPEWRGSVTARNSMGEPLRVPAGRFVASLAVRGRAPDLHLLDLQPAEHRTLSYRPREGWSLLLRMATREGDPVPAVSLDLNPAEGYGDSTAQRWKGKADESGLAVVSGLSPPLFEARLEHPDFVPETVHGLTASPGTFAFEEAVLSEGGTVRAQVTRQGEPVARAACEIKRPFRPTRYDEVDPRPPAYEGTTDSEGVCEARLAEGEYVLGVRIPGVSQGARWADRVHVVDQEQTRIDVALTPIRVTGEVLRGTEPAPGYTVVLRETSRSERQFGPSLVEVDSDEEGRYETVIWQAGKYSAALLDPKGFPADMAITWLQGPEETLDFLLAEAEIVGRVVDDEGNPLAEAMVSLAWPEEARLEHRLTVTDETGIFAFSVDQKSGLAALESVHPGHDRDRQKIQVQSGVPPPPVRLVLKKLNVVAGTVRRSNGAPLPGARVVAYGQTQGLDPVELGGTRTNAQGRFELPRGRLEATQIFITGPGCPLTVFDPSRPGLDLTELEIRCAALPGAVRLMLQTEDGAPFPEAFFYLRRGNVVIPRNVLRSHQKSLGLPATTDGSGRVTLVGLEPGTYDLYLGGVTNIPGILQGRPEGHLASARLAPLEMRELAVTVRSPMP